jgi:hypothetical protein
MPFSNVNDFGQTDRDLLISFLKAVYELLEQAVRTTRDPLGGELFVEELIGPMRAAFPELGDHFGRMDAAIRALPDERMIEHGLTGQQLRFKLAAVSYRERIYGQIGRIFRFKGLLDTLEGLLDSIIDAAGVGGAIKEFKEAVRNSTRDDG